jgi:putative DNA primase/helicase
MPPRSITNGRAPHRLGKQAQPVPFLNDYAPLTKAEGRTDVNNAIRLGAKYGEEIRWVGPWDKWLIWDEKRWKVDQALVTDQKAKDVAAELFNDFTAALRGNVDSDTLKAMLAFAKYSNNKNGIRNMIAMAKGDLAIGPEELDTNPWLFNVENGTLDLRTGELREHRKEDFLTKLAPVTFDPDVDYPLWRRFLGTIFAGDKELIGYVRRLVGYCLTGVTEEHLLPFLYGTGANGKSTLVETILKLLGPDYAMKAAPDLLMAKRGDSHPTDRADLFGKRFVACVETEEGRRLAEALVKELTGGDRVRARRMKEDFWEFAPTHHVWLAGNHKPTILGTDHGIWRRIKLIPFEVVIPEAEQDKKLPAKLAEELPGILNWAVVGCLEWQCNGMREPALVGAKTQEYAEDMDEVGPFIDEQCELGPEFMAPATELYQAFVTARPNSRINQRAFGSRLRQRGFLNRDPETSKEYRITSGPNKAKHAWKGLRLKSDANDEIAWRLAEGLPELEKRMAEGNDVQEGNP